MSQSSAPPPRSRGSRVIYLNRPSTTSEDLFPFTKDSAKPAVLDSIFSQMNIDPSSAPIIMDTTPSSTKELAAPPLPQLLCGGIGYGIPQVQPQIKPYLLPFLKPVTATSNITFRRVDPNPMNAVDTNSSGGRGRGIRIQRGSGTSSIMTQGVKRTIIKNGRGNGSRNRGPRRRDNHWGKDATKEELDAELDKVRLSIFYCMRN
jgi:hypothetical protein